MSAARSADVAPTSAPSLRHRQLALLGDRVVVAEDWNGSHAAHRLPHLDPDDIAYKEQTLDPNAVGLVMAYECEECCGDQPRVSARR